MQEDKTVEEIQAESAQKAKEFVEQRQRAEGQADEVLSIAASKIVERVLNKSTLYSQEDLEREIFQIIKKVSSSDIIDRLLDHMKCPMLTKPNWKYCTGCEKGREEWCDSIKFLECPAFSQYRAHELVEGPKRKLSKDKADGKKVAAAKKK